MALVDDIDNFLRIFIIILFFAFFGYLVWHANKCKELPTKRNFTFMFALFFLFTGINFLITEIDIRAESSIYPIIIPPDFRVQFIVTFTPINSDFFLIFFFLLSVLPMLYAFEKNILQQKRFIVTYMGLACLGVLFITLLLSNYYILAVGVIYSWVCIVLLILRLIFIYFKLAFKGMGEIRTMAIIIGLGYALIFLGTLFTSMWDSLGDASEVMGHSISLIGILCEFIGVLKMK